MQIPATEPPERIAARRWFALSVSSLIVAGLLALLLVVARMPALSGLVGEPAFFRRCLVVHVDLSLVVWFSAFIAGQSFLITGPGRSAPHTRYGVWISTAGVVALLLSAAAPGARPILANYVPVIDHVSFAAGLVLFALGVLLAIADRRLLPGSEFPSVLALPTAAATGVRAALLALLLAALTFAAAHLPANDGLTAEVSYELRQWGGGHVLQLATSAAMVATWLGLVARACGRPPLSRGASAALFGFMTAPWLLAPLLPLAGVQDVGARQLFTELMRFAIFPAVTVALGACLREVWRCRTDRRIFSDARVRGFLASAALTLLGYVLGACIRGSSTIVPAHYHACIGAVTVSFMTLGYELVEPLGLRAPQGKLAERVRRFQPLAFGVGQSVFAIGFALAGAHGAGRKLYGSEQHVRSASEAFGLVVMGVGGALAIVAGVAFLAYVSAAWGRTRMLYRGRERYAPRFAH